MADWVADRAGTKLVSQIDILAPNRSKASDGTIGDADHAARTSAHNPEDSADATAPGNPDNQVDAFDVTHDPADGCDIGVFWEQIRASRDMRAKFAVFNRRCFSNYPHNGIPAFTWRPYSGINPHDKHGHIEIDDRYHDQTQDWKISMALSDADKQWILTTVVQAVRNSIMNGDADDAAGAGGEQMLWVKIDRIHESLNRIEPQVDAIHQLATDGSDDDDVTGEELSALAEEIATATVEKLSEVRFIPAVQP